MTQTFQSPSAKILSTILFLGFIMGLWFLFAPIQVGGSVAYVMVSGNSMEPKYHFGDLIVVRAGQKYQVGEAVVYQHPEEGHIFHRIIGREGGKFLLQGDNNSWIDSHQPSSNEIVGKLWLYLPFGGTIIGYLREPINMTLLTVVMVIAITVSPQKKQSKNSKHKKKQKKQKTMDREINNSIGQNMEGLIVSSAIALGALVIGIIAFVRPVEKLVDDNVEYKHLGILIYQAPDSEDIYDADEIQTGEPVFLNMTCDVQLFYSYQLDSGYLHPDEAASNFGSYRVTARVSDPNGWNRTIGLLPLTEFAGSGFTAGMNMDLCHIRDLITQMEEKTATNNNWYDLTLLPEVYIVGSVVGRPMEDSFAPQIEFEIDENLMRLPISREDVGLEALTPIETGMIPGARMAQNVLNIFGLKILIAAARWISSVALGLALIGVFVFGWPIFREWRSGDASRIRVQYNPVLVDVESGNLATNGQVVSVASFDDLAKLADRYGAIILSETNGTSNKYCVQDGDVIYEYVLKSGETDLVLPGVSSLHQAMMNALELEEFQLYYQPIVSTEDNHIIAAEALLRWFHPEKGLIFPAEFISVAEERGMMDLIDNWVIRKACQQLKSWTDEEILPVVISVNVSPQRFVQQDFADWVTETIREIGCDARYLQFEINRANSIVGEAFALSHFGTLQKLGVRLAIDNFAASTSNQVDSMTRLPLNSLKIDRTLVNQIFQSPEDTRLVSAVVKMAQSLELHIVAEGVETPDQMAFLRDHQIDAAQGYLTGHPMPENDITPMLIEGIVLSESSEGSDDVS